MKAWESALERLGVPATTTGLAIGADFEDGEGAPLRVRSPIDGTPLRELRMASPAQLRRALAASRSAFAVFRDWPAPRRGELVRRIGELLRAHADDLATLVTHEVGKIPAEARGEVQEMIDIADFAVWQSRQLYGLTIASERPQHRLAEQWLPLGPVG